MTLGALHLRIYNLQTNDVLSVTIDVRNPNRRDIMYKIGEHLTIDFKSGRICVGKRTDAVAEHITLAFTISVLFTLCAPGPSAYTTAALKHSLMSCTRCYQRSGPESIGFIAAGGYLTERPASKLNCLQKGDNQWELGIGAKMFKFSLQNGADIYSRQSSNGSYCNSAYEPEHGSHNSDEECNDM